MKEASMRYAIVLCVLAGGCEVGVSGGDREDDGAGPLDDLTCFYGPDPATPIATVEHQLETHAGTDAVHVRLILDPRFVDNTFGATAIGWVKPDGTPRARDFAQLVGSDHAELVLDDATGAPVIDARLDYLSADPAAPSGYRSLGVRGGDGAIVAGDGAAVLAVITSLDRNLNERGHAGYVVDSPATDLAYTPDPAAPSWDFRVVYEAWIALAAFGAPGFGAARVDFVHASPSKASTNTIIVEPAPCPPGFCTDADGCYEGPSCTDPDGCPGDGGGGCTSDADCPVEEFCSPAGTCTSVVE
jgi:hypothetical protein